MDVSSRSIGGYEPDFTERHVRGGISAGYVHRRRGCTPSTQLVSAITGGSSEGNSLGGASASLTKDGRFVGFSSAANKSRYSKHDSPSTTCATPAQALLPAVRHHGPRLGDPKRLEPSAGCRIPCWPATVVMLLYFLGADVVSGVPTRNEIYLSSCSANNLGAGFLNAILVLRTTPGTPADIGAQQPAISADGRFVAFASTSTNLPGVRHNSFVRPTTSGAHPKIRGRGCKRHEAPSALIAGCCAPISAGSTGVVRRNEYRVEKAGPKLFAEHELR